MTLGERVARSAALEQEGKLLEAADYLAQLPEHDHSQLAPLVKEASERRVALVSMREQAVARRSAIFDEAQKLCDQCHYAAALECLQQMPVSLRDQQIQSLLVKVENTLQQIKHLRAQLREKLRQGELDGLIELAGQLRRLEPGAEDVCRLYDQLRQRQDERGAALALPLLKQARDAIGINDYLRAEACLDQIATSAIEKLDVDHRKLLGAIEERIWLERQVRLAPYADNTLLRLAARLAKLQPNDGQIRKLHAEMSARLVGSNHRLQPCFAPWAYSKGVLIKPLNELEQLAWDPGNPKIQSWMTASRRHLVAAGLALHGLGAARLDFELKRSDSATWLTRLTDIRRRRMHAAAWGLDFGTTGLKVVRLARIKDEITVESSNIIPYGEISVGSGIPDVHPYFASALQQFLEQFSPTGEPLVVGFPGAQSLGRFFRIPGTDLKKIDAALEFEAPKQIPLPLDQVVYSTHVWITPENINPEDSYVTLVAAKKAHVDLRVGPFAKSRASVWSLQSDCIALLNLMLHSHASQIESLGCDEALALIEIGDVATNIVAISPQRGPWFRTIYRGSRSLNVPLVTALGKTWQQAEELRQNWSGQSLAAIDKALMPALAQLTRELRQALEFCKQTLKCSFNCIYIVGGGCHQFGLLREWSPSEESKLASGVVKRNLDAGPIDDECS